MSLEQLSDGSQPPSPVSKKGKGNDHLRKRAYVFINNNYGIDDDDIEQTLGNMIEDNQTQYVGCGKEVGDGTFKFGVQVKEGTPHLQGYIYFHNKKSFKQVVKYLEDHFNKHCHVEIAKGSFVQNLAYTSKDKNFFEAGDRPMNQAEKGEAGKDHYRNLIALAEADDFETIKRDYPKEYIVFNTNLEKVRVMGTKDPVNLPPGTITGIWVTAVAGSGKSYNSRLAMEEFGVKYYPKPLNKWWEHYKNQQAILIEELDPDNIKFHSTNLKTWVDEYPFIADKKNSSLFIRPKVFVVTSQYTIEEVCAHDPKLYEAINRRFHLVHIASTSDDDRKKAREEIKQYLSINFQI